MRKHGETFNDLKNWIEDYLQVRRRFCGNCSNTQVYIEYKDRFFPFLVCNDNYFHIWADDDVSHILQEKYKQSDIPPDYFQDKVKTVLDEYIEGMIKCSDCGIKIKKSEIAGRYFAGGYCKKCWDKTWKEIESKETYD